MPASVYEDDEVEKLYDAIEEILEDDGKGNTNNVIPGDWNRIVGDESYQNIVGSHGHEASSLAQENYLVKKAQQGNAGQMILGRPRHVKRMKKELLDIGTWNVNTIY